jgi:cation:H+ antiporter
MIDVILFVLGIGVVLWAAERLTDGVVAVAASFAVSAFFVGVLVSGFEPENLVTGVVANFEGLSQVALGTVIGAAVFMLLGGFGVALLIVPMKVEIPRWGALAMVLSLLPFGWVLLNDGMVSRSEGLLLVFVCGALMVWLYRTSPILVAARTVTVVAIGESLEETARMVSPARRGRSDIALGNVVGTTIILVTLNLGLIALLHPITADA